MQKIWMKSKDATKSKSLAISQNSLPPKLASVLAFRAIAHLGGYRTPIPVSATARKPAQMDIHLTLKSVNVAALENVQVDFH